MSKKPKTKTSVYKLKQEIAKLKRDNMFLIEDYDLAIAIVNDCKKEIEHWKAKAEMLEELQEEGSDVRCFSFFP